MKIAVTGATGVLGQLVVAGLLDAGIPAADVVAIVRDPARAEALAQRGVDVRRGDYDDPPSLGRALAGVDRLLLISGSEFGQRIRQHGAVVEAAAANHVGLIVYTSAPKAADTDLAVAPEHKATEELIAGSGIPAIILRNNWYLENYDGAIINAAQTGQVVGGAGDGRIAATTRADFAAAAVAVLTADDPAPAVYEVGADEAWTLSELAAAVAAEAGRPVTFTNVGEAEHAAYLAAAGLPEAVAAMYAAIDQQIADGALDTGSTDLSQLIGRPTTTLQEYVHQVLSRP